MKNNYKAHIRTPISLKRSGSTREPYDVVLIVCEGSKTEPNYFQKMKEHYRLSNANIVICDNKHGSDPLSIVNCAVEKLKQDNNYDRVYCVFDKDKHQTFNDAIQKLKNSRYHKKLFRVLSVPCFELWLLLHFEYTTKSFQVVDPGSDCQRVISELKKHIPNYAKGNVEIFKLTKDKITIAIENAKKLQQHRISSNTPMENPSTEVHMLVEYLSKLNK